MLDAAEKLLVNDNFTVVERFELPGRPAHYAPIPQFLFDSEVGSYLRHNFNYHDGKLWFHQTAALEALSR